MDHLRPEASTFSKKSGTNMHTLKNSWSNGRKSQKRMTNDNTCVKSYDGQVSNMLWEH